MGAPSRERVIQLPQLVLSKVYMCLSCPGIVGGAESPELVRRRSSGLRLCGRLHNPLSMASPAAPSEDRALCAFWLDPAGIAHRADEFRRRRRIATCPSGIFFRATEQYLCPDAFWMARRCIAERRGTCRAPILSMVATAPPNGEACAFVHFARSLFADSRTRAGPQSLDFARQYVITLHDLAPVKVRASACDALRKGRPNG